MGKQVITVDKCGQAYYVGTIHLVTSDSVVTQDLWDKINVIKKFYTRLQEVDPSTHDLMVKGA